MMYIRRDEEIEAGLFTMDSKGGWHLRGTEYPEGKRKAIFLQTLEPLDRDDSDNNYLWKVEISPGSGMYQYAVYTKFGTRIHWLLQSGPYSDDILNNDPDIDAATRIC